jgi:hypothetical protein
MSVEETIDNMNDGEDYNPDTYEPPTQFTRPPDPGLYKFMRTDGEDDLKTGTFKTRDGRQAEWANFKAEIVEEGPNKGRIAYGGTNTLIGTFRHASTAQDFLHSAKSPFVLDPSKFVKKGHYNEAIEQTFGPFGGITKWQWRCKDCMDSEGNMGLTFLTGNLKSVKPPKKFGKLPGGYKLEKVDGELSHIQTCPECGQKVGANLIITGYKVEEKAKIARVAKTAPANLPPLDDNDIPF